MGGAFLVDEEEEEERGRSSIPSDMLLCLSGSGRLRVDLFLV